MGEIYEKMDSVNGKIRDLMARNKHVDDVQKMKEIRSMGENEHPDSLFSKCT